MINRINIEISLKFSTHRTFLILLEKFNLKITDFESFYEARQRLIDCIINDI